MTSKNYKVTVWEPILTSPRDGTPIIVAKFGKNEIGEDCGFWWISKGHFDAERQCWHDGIERLSWPTHWMPVAYPVSEGLDELLKEDDATKARRYLHCKAPKRESGEDA